MNQRQSPEVEELILKNRRLVYHIAKKYLATYNDMEELASIGTIGLIKAAQTFNKSKGTLFTSYAGMCINNEILMFLKKEKPYANDISLDDILNEDGEGNDLTLLDVLPNSNTDFTESIVNQDVFERFISIVLNLLNSKERLIMLYKISDMSQPFISKKINLSQSYISRLEKKVVKTVKSYLINYEPFKEVFSMAIQNDLYRISFSSKNVKNFCKNFSTLLQKLQPDSNLPDFKVNCNNERIVIWLPADPQSFYFVAEIMEEIDDFSMTYTSGRNTSSDNNMSEEDKEVCEIKAVKKPEQSEVINISSTPAVITEPESCDKPDSTQTDLSSDSNQHVKKGFWSKQVREYILSLNSFTVKDLKKHFPDVSNANIGFYVHSAKADGLIKAISRGEYVVVSANKKNT